MAKEKAHQTYIAYAYTSASGIAISRTLYRSRQPVDMDNIREIERQLENELSITEVVILGFINIGLVDFDTTQPRTKPLPPGAPKP